jgi:phosphatidylserine/phosphatidylglycerophosphate/cardiolipin synthase-like enzyme
VVTTNAALVKEGLALFEADAARQVYRPRNEQFVVSPVNSRERLSAFIRGARRELLIYDPRFTDRAMGTLLAQRTHDGIKVRVIGKAHHRIRALLDVRKYNGFRLHVRAIVRDGQDAFVGSQSLGRMAFEDRREIGLIIRDADIARRMRSIFQRDWSSGGGNRQ